MIMNKTPDELANLCNHDATRIIYSLNEVASKEVIEGPIIALKGVTSFFPRTYATAIEVLRESIGHKLKGKRYVVREVRFKQLVDASKEMWGDYGRHYADIDVLKDLSPPAVKWIPKPR